MDFDAIRPTDHPPPRPAVLRPLEEQYHGRDSAQVFAQLLIAGQTVVLGGISLIGPNMHVVPIISVVHRHDSMLRGWGLAVGHPTKSLDFDYIDVEQGLFPISDFLPDTIIYFLGTTEARLALRDASQADLTAIARFVFPFISDDGPPRDIDW